MRTSDYSERVRLLAELYPLLGRPGASTMDDRHQFTHRPDGTPLTEREIELVRTASVSDWGAAYELIEEAHGY